MLKKYYDIKPVDEETEKDMSDTESMFSKTNKTDTYIEPEVEILTGDFKNDIKTFIIDKHISDLNNLNNCNKSNEKNILKNSDQSSEITNLDDLDISDSFSKDCDYDYDLTYVHHNIIPINISIDIKDKYERIIKHIKLKKNERIINIPIFCIKDSYLLDHVLEDQVIQIIINVRPHNLYIKNNDIIYKKNVSLYEYYFNCNYKIPLPNDEFLDVNDSNIYSKKCKIEEGKGMPKSEYKNGNIIIFYELKLPEKIEDIYKSVIQAIFPPLN